MIIDDTAVRTAGLGRRIIALLTETVAGPAILVIAAAVAALAVGDALFSDALEDLPTPITVDDAPVLPSDEEPSGGWDPGTRGAIVDAPADDSEGSTGGTTGDGDATGGLVEDLRDTVTDTTDELLDDVGEVVEDATGTVDDVVDDVTDTVDDVLDETGDALDDTVEDLTDPDTSLP